MLPNAKEVLNNNNMTLPIIIEPMKENDLSEVNAIEVASFDPPWPLQSFKTDLKQNRLAYYMVARHEGTLVGYVGAWIVLDEVHITTLAVDKDYRRQGIANSLIDNLLNEACRRGANSMSLEVRPSNKAARSFYKKWGFTVCGRRKRYYPDEDALIMTRSNLPDDEKNPTPKKDMGDF